MSEVDGQGTWQRAVIGISMTGAEEIPVRRALLRAVEFVEETHLAQVIGSEIEIIRLPLASGSFEGDEEMELEAGEDLPWSRNLGETKLDEE